MVATEAAPPVIRVIVAVIERLDALGALAARELVRIGALEEARRQLDQPLGVDCAHLCPWNMSLQSMQNVLLPLDLET